MTQRAKNGQKATHISQCLQLAMLLEVSANKPGNVNFTTNFKDTCKEHFLASAIATGPTLQKAAKRGIQIAEGKRAINKAGLGELVKLCTKDVMTWQHGGNTILGTIILFIPISIAAGMTYTNEKDKVNLEHLRKNIDNIIRASTATDSVHLYEAINIAMPSGLNQAPDLSVNDPNSKQRLIKENITLYQVFDIAKNYDDICKEWINNYPITFNEAHPYLTEQLTKTNQNTAIINTFLKILAQHPDTFIARKAGIEKAKEISKEAKKALELGGATTNAGKTAITKLDQHLRKTENHYNPGTTADITAATIALCTLNGYRP
ncbi:MAG: triphosphoribosyl-dephospho-CoA synthase [Nitrososphaerota archaeon]|jgi:triphosphoribosyl-dephospho-CoA synthase|nr:triphosphoribosyl-dephospho-CoA synthase [Nitrososphaerota archaeon]